MTKPIANLNQKNGYMKLQENMHNLILGKKKSREKERSPFVCENS